MQRKTTNNEINMDKLEHLKEIRFHHRNDPDHMLKLISIIRQLQTCRSCVRYFIQDTYQQSANPTIFRMLEISREFEKYLDVLEELFEGCLTGPHRFSYQRHENIGHDDLCSDDPTDEKSPELPDEK